jgi:hypothetical protein
VVAADIAAVMPELQKLWPAAKPAELERLAWSMVIHEGLPSPAGKQDCLDFRLIRYSHVREVLAREQWRMVCEVRRAPHARFAHLAPRARLARLSSASA